MPPKLPRPVPFAAIFITDVAGELSPFRVPTTG